MRDTAPVGRLEETAIADGLHLLGVRHRHPPDASAAHLLWFDRFERELRHAVHSGEVVLQGTVMGEVRRVSERGSPAWCLSGAAGPIAKIRVNPCRDVAARIVRFLRHAEDINWAGCARLLGHRGCAVLKTWMPGSPLRDRGGIEQRDVLRATALRLAELHGSTRTSFLICGADLYNTIVLPDGNVAFVDLEACTRGFWWLDVAWSEALLCRNEDEREELWRDYLLASGRQRLDRDGRERARVGYLRWVRVQLLGGLQRSPSNEEIRRDLKEVDARLGGAAS